MRSLRAGGGGGNLGSKDSTSYIAVGGVESLPGPFGSSPPLYGCSIIVGEHTAHLANDDFLMRQVDQVLVRGAARPMAIYQPLVELREATPIHREIVARYANALEHYRARRFAEAIAACDELPTKHEPAPSPPPTTPS